MKVTVCELNDARDAFARDWERLVDHVKSESSQLVLLPEMAFCSWFAAARDFDPAVWEQAVAAHVTPRATPISTVSKWLTGGRAAAVISGAFSLSSNRAGAGEQSMKFGGQGWIIGPDGDALGLTSRECPFVTLDIDLSEAERAKSTYPRYVSE